MRVLTIGSKTMKWYCVLLFVAVFGFVFSIAQLLCGVGNGGEEYIVYVDTDTYISSYQSNQSFEGDTRIFAGGFVDDEENSYLYRGMLYYDLSSIPSGTQILSATWHVYVTYALEYEEPLDYVLCKITENWIDQPSYDWTWNNYCDSYDSENPQLTHLTPKSTGWKYFSFSDVTVLQEWIDDPSTNYGFMWKLDNESSLVNYSRMNIFSEETTFDSHLAIYDFYLDIQPTSIGYIRALFK